MSILDGHAPIGDRAAMKRLVLVCLLVAGCATAAATRRSVPRERADECRANCASLGMELSAMVIMMNSAGCVCQPAGRPSASTTGAGAAAIAGSVAIVVAARHVQPTIPGIIPVTSTH
jgi:hypothetical protein